MPRKPVNPKVKAGAATGSVATALVVILGYAGIDVSAEVAVALLTVVTFVVSYIKKA